MREDRRIQQYLRRSAGAGRDTSDAVPGFTIHINPNDPLRYLNYAIPEPGEAACRDDSIERLIEFFRDRDRLPRLEWIESCSPDLAPRLEQHGFELELRTDLMVCRPEDVRDPGAPAGLETEMIDGKSGDDSVLELLALEHRAFGLDDPGPDAVREFRERARSGSFALLGRIDGQPAVAGVMTPPDGGLAEIGGIATAERFRRRGFAARVTYETALAGFGRGVDLAMLTPGDEATGRVYARAGFRARFTALSYATP